MLGWYWWTQATPQRDTQVFPGITYTCLTFDETEIRGRAHLVTIDLTTPGLRLHATPTDPELQRTGWEYRTRWLPSAAATENLAVAVNGTLFTQQASEWVVWPGQLARGEETIVADRQVNHVDPNSYLLWFDADLNPHLETAKPPSAEALRAAKVGVSGQGVVIHAGQVSSWANHVADARTCVGFDAAKKLLLLGVFENASEHRAAEMLAQQGATEAIMLDGGSSSGLTFGPGATGLPRRTLVYPRRAVATIFGVGLSEPAR